MLYSPLIMEPFTSASGKGKRSADDPASLQSALTQPLTPYDALCDRLSSLSLEFRALINEEELKNQLQNPVSGRIIKLPLTPFIDLSHRLTSVKEDAQLPIIQTCAIDALQTHVQRFPRGFAYVRGPHGFGKSFALYHLFCALSTYPQNRVLYIPDCSALNQNILIGSLTSAFAADPTFLRSTLLPRFREPIYWRSIFFYVRIHCNDSKLTFYTILDQHNTASPTCDDALPYVSERTDTFPIIVAAAIDNDRERLEYDWGGQLPILRHFHSNRSQRLARPTPLLRG